MSIWEWFGLGVEIMGALYTFRLVAGKVAWMYDHYPQADNIAGGVIAGLFAAAVWPIALLFVLLKGKTSLLRYFLVERVFPSPYPRRELKQQRRWR